MPAFHRLAAAALIGTSGTLVMLAMLWPQWRSDWPFLIAAAIGAGSMGYLFADCFGQSGRRGLGLCVLGALLTTLCGAAVAGLGLGLVLGPTPIGVIVGPMAVGQALVTSPSALAIWIGTMAMAHALIGLVRTGLPVPS